MLFIRISILNQRLWAKMHPEKIHVIHVEIIISNTIMPVKLKTAFNYIFCDSGFQTYFSNRIFSSNEILGSSPIQSRDLLWLKHEHMSGSGHVSLTEPAGRKPCLMSNPFPCHRSPEASPWNPCDFCESELENHRARKRQPPF